MLNNVLECQIPIGQAAEILVVTERHTRRLLIVLAGGRERQPWFMDTGDASLTTPSGIPRLPQWYG